MEKIPKKALTFWEDIDNFIDPDESDLEENSEDNI